MKSSQIFVSYNQRTVEYLSFGRGAQIKKLEDNNAINELFIYQQVSVHCSASATFTEQCTKCRRKNGDARKEYKYPITFRRDLQRSAC